MTVVTGISLYSDPGVICVIAVTAQKFDESAFSRSLGAILDAQRPQHLIGELAEILCDHIGRDLLLPHFGQQLRSRAYPFGAALHKVHHPKQKFRQFRLMNVLAVLALNQFPDKVVKLQGQFLILHITPTDQQRSGVSAALAAQDEVGVRSADDACGTADIVKGIVAVLQLSQVMHQQNGDVEAVGNALDGGNVIVRRVRPERPYGTAGCRMLPCAVFYHHSDHYRAGQRHGGAVAMPDALRVDGGLLGAALCAAQRFNLPLGQFTRNYTQTTKRGLLTTNKG